VTDLLQHAITARALQRPEAPAVVLDDEVLRYGDLETASNRVARALREAGCRRGDRVCLLVPKSPTVVIALLGVLKADAIWVPLDPANPPARLASMIASSDCRWILAAGPVEGTLDSLFTDPAFAAAHSVGWLDRRDCRAARVVPSFTWQDLEAHPASAPDTQNRGGDPAHILFTSGSTGVPKGVVITHANVLHFIRWASEYFGTQPADRVSWHPPLHFDLATFDIFNTLSVGACLYPVSTELSLLPHKLADFIREHELTQWFSVPSVFNYVAKFDVLRANDLPSVRRVLWCGEVLPTPTLRYWMERVPHARFTNLYGPTEATIASSYYTVPEPPTDERASIPIGRPCPGEDLLVLDEALQPVSSGEIGDLYIRGVGLSPGYWRDEEKTKLAFLPNPKMPGDRIYRTGDLAKVGADGLFYYFGRTDAQIKSRGYRIELGEIETALHSLHLVRECAVVGVTSGGFEGTIIACAYVADPARAVAVPALRAALSKLVPAYMLPARWLECAALPKNANGKIDRPQLRTLFQREAVAPRVAASPT